MLDVTVSPDGRTVYAVTSDNLVQQRDAESGEVPALLPSRDGWDARLDGSLPALQLIRTMATLSVHVPELTAFVASTDGQHAFTACADGSINIWNMVTAEVAGRRHSWPARPPR